MVNTQLCTQVTLQCPVEATTLGYYPNLGANIFFCVVYAICAFVTVTIGVWKRTWAFGLVVSAGLVLEAIGYAGRIIMHFNPWDSAGFKMDLVCIILAPTLICAGIYLTLKHVARTVGPNFSRIKPRLYTWIFIPFDIFCLCLQAVGGGVDAAASNSDVVDESKLKAGNNIIIAGIVLQVVNLGVFGALSLDFFLRAQSHFRSASEAVHTSAEGQIWFSRRFRIFWGSVACAYAGILIRCIYRIAEMSGGWGNHIMRNEVLFYVLEGAMVLYPAILLSIFSPGIFFPEMGNKTIAKSVGNDAEKETGVETPEERVLPANTTTA